MYQKRNRRQEFAAVRRFAESIDKPFPDLQPRKGDGKTVREALHCSALLRRIQFAEDAGLLMKLDPEMQQTIRDMEREIMERQLRAMQ